MPKTKIKLPPAEHLSLTQREKEALVPAHHSDSQYREGLFVRAIFRADRSYYLVTGQLHEESSSWYVCQDCFDGARCMDTLKYKYSWAIGGSDTFNIVPYMQGIRGKNT